MRLVIDASVALKWVLDPTTEPDADKALHILRAVAERRHEATQPVHWLIEVLAVVARAAPDRLTNVLDIFDALPFEVVDGRRLQERAAGLAIDLHQHLFDTLYYAVALEHGATLVTADHRYFAAAAEQGQITLLSDLDLAA